MAAPYTAVLFDLDGTIADSAPGITATLAETFAELGRPIPTPAELLVWVGPPILDSFRDLAGMTPEQSAEALAIYRPRYLDHGALDSRAFPGVGDVIRAVHAAGIPMSLATSKPEAPATLMLDTFGLLGEFDVITGASADEVRSAKADVVEEALRRLAAIGADLTRPVLVGDREHDVEGAAVHGIPTIIVDWGYGSVAEQAGAIAVAHDPAELQRLLLG